MQSVMFINIIMTVTNYQHLLLIIIYVYVCDLLYYLLTISTSVWFVSVLGSMECE